MRSGLRLGRGADTEEGVESPVARPSIIKPWRVLPYGWLTGGAVILGVMLCLLMMIPEQKIEGARVTDVLPFAGDCPGESDDEGKVDRWVWAGGPAPDFIADEAGGGRIAMSNYLGKQAVWLNFWDPGCRYCAPGMPDMAVMYEAHREQGLELIAVSVGEPRASMDMMEEKGYEWPLVLDPAYRVGERYCVDSVPAHVFVDREGMVRRILIGRPTLEQLKKAIERILS